MTFSPKAAGVLLATLSLSACTGDGDNRDTIAGLVRSYFDAIEDNDLERIVGLISSDCVDIEERVKTDLREFQDFREDLKFEVTTIEIESLPDGSVNIRPQGTVLVDGEPRPFFSEGGEFTRVAQIDGQWEFLDCEFFGESR